MSMFNVNTNRPLIPRQQNYVLDRKCVTIHSDDRDIKKWPFSNYFEIELPQTMENVESMRLVEINLPVNNPQFKNDYQNTKLKFTVIPKNLLRRHYNTLLDYSGQEFEIAIQDGFYCPEELAMEIQQRMNEEVASYVQEFYIDHTMPPSSLPQGDNIVCLYENFRVFWDKVGMRFWFGNIEDDFTLLFDKKSDYVLDNCRQPSVWSQTNRWGLPSYLGFKRETYEAEPAISDGIATCITFHYMGPDSHWMSPEDASLPVYYVRGPGSPFLTADRAIYMECEKYNSIDELKPYVQFTNASSNYDSSRLFNNHTSKKLCNTLKCGSQQNYDYNGYVNSCFAKIPITNTPLGALNDSRNGFLQNVTSFDVPEEKISKLKFTFRYHDGRLVDFDDIPFDFTIEFNQLKNEILRTYQVRVPNAFKL